MLPKHIRAWCRARNTRWSTDPKTKYDLVLAAYADLGQEPPNSVLRAAEQHGASLDHPVPAARPRAKPKRKRAERTKRTKRTKRAQRPDSHYCPISQEVMRDPVIAPDGHSYERDMLEKWLRVRRTSPLTQQPVPIGAETPRNHALRKAIQDFN